MNKSSLIIAAFLMLSTACSSSKGSRAYLYNATYAGAPTIIYKTKGDYANNVPITLSDDRTKVVAYPAPQDVFFNGKLAVPTQLHKGYLLSNRGVNANTAFIRLTYKEYNQLLNAPSLAELFSMIIDADPLTNLYDLGNRDRFKDVEKDINYLIDKDELSKFKKGK